MQLQFQGFKERGAQGASVSRAILDNSYQLLEFPAENLNCFRCIAIEAKKFNCVPPDEQGVEFGSRTRNVVFDIFTGKGQDMVFTVYGEHWRRMRRIMTVPFFTNKVVQQSRVAWEDETSRVIEDLKENPKYATAATTGVVLRRRLQLLMYNTMYRLMFDRRSASSVCTRTVKLSPALQARTSKSEDSFICCRLLIHEGLQVRTTPFSSS